MAAAHPPTTKVIDESQVAPPPGCVSTTTVPLTFLDVTWVTCRVQSLVFYELSCTALHFKEHVLPYLKESLSLTLRHFFPFAANLTCPPLPNEPYILYNEDSGIQVTAVESDADFGHLVTNHARDVKTLKSLVPTLPFICLSSNTTHVGPVMAIQFTVFPNSGICVGVTCNHAAADGMSVNHFMKFWSSIHRSQGEDLSSLSLPYCSKDVIKDSKGFLSILLKDLQSLEPPEMGGHVPDYVMITLVLKRAKIEQLKHWVKSQSKTNDELDKIHISSFTVTCAFVWVNLLKLQEQIYGQLDDDVIYYFLAPVDCRERFFSEVPASYMGNCLTPMRVPARKRELMGESGVAFAAKAIGRKIYELGSETVLKDVEKWIPMLEDLFKHNHVVTVVSSPKLQVYNTDFGWGRPKKTELAHLNPYGCFSFTESRDEDGGYEIGIVIEPDKVDIFNAIFERS